MAVDDLGRSQIDFVWGNLPMQPNNNDGAGDDARWGNSPYPGDGEAEYFQNPDAQYARGGYTNSNQLQAIDSHVIAMRHWQNYPQFTPGAGNTLTVDWWEEGQPAYQYPNIVGLPVEDAVKQLKECGVNPAILVDLKFDNENPYNGMPFGEVPLLNAPGADNPGVIVWRYMDPTNQIGTHWDGRPWYAAESDGKVLTTNYYPSNWVAVGEYETNYFQWWHSFVVLQTTDPNKNSYEWYNW